MNDQAPRMFDEEELVTSRRRRQRLAGGVGVLVAAAAVAASAVVLTGGDGTTVDPLPAAASSPMDPVAAPSGEPTPAPDATTGDEPARTTELFSAKNPFTPLVDMNPGASAPASGTAPTDTSGAVITPEAGATTAPVAPTAAPVQPTNEPEVARKVEVMDVFTSAAGRVVATVKVNDQLHEVGETDTFAAVYKVVSLSQADRCGNFLYGDDAFALCAGQQILK